MTSHRSSRRPGSRCFATLAVAVLAAALGGGDARAETKGRIDLRVRVEPADLAPGATGMLVVAATLGDLVAFAEGDAALAWRAVPAQGVTFGTPETPVTWATKPAGVEMTAPKPMKDPSGEAYAVWQDTFELRVPVEIARDAAPATTLALSFDYSVCDKTVCYTRRKEHRVALTLGAPAEPAAGDAVETGASGEPPAFPVTSGAGIDEESPPAPLAWTRVDTVDDLRRAVADAAKDKKPVVVTLTAPWCAYCKRYLELVDGETDLREGFGQLVRLQIDVATDARTDLRAALGIGAAQPQMVFFDREGRILRALDVRQWYGDADKSALALRRRLVRVLSPR